jgi:hypothetical protein
MGCRVLLLDEPSSDLDDEGRVQDAADGGLSEHGMAPVSALTRYWPDCGSPRAQSLHKNP